MEVQKITVGIEVSINVSRETAETCLRLVEIYANENHMHVHATVKEDGCVRLEFEDERSE